MLLIDLNLYWQTKMEKTRFDLEQEIMECWNVTKDIQNLYYASESMTEDQLLNYLLGLEQIYEVKFNKLWNTFEQCIRKYQI
jgi:hypothetical protein